MGVLSGRKLGLIQGSKFREHLGNAARKRLPHVCMAVDQPGYDNMVWQADDTVCRSEFRRDISRWADPSYNISFNEYCCIAQSPDILAQRLQNRNVLRRDCAW